MQNCVPCAREFALPSEVLPHAGLQFTGDVGELDSPTRYQAYECSTCGAKWKRPGDKSDGLPGWAQLG